MECSLDGEINVGELALRDYIDAAMGLEQLSRLIDEPADSLTRMSLYADLRASTISGVLAQFPLLRVIYSISRLRWPTSRSQSQRV